MLGVRDTKWLYSNDGRLRKCSDFCFVLVWFFCQLDTNYRSVGRLLDAT